MISSNKWEQGSRGDCLRLDGQKRPPWDVETWTRCTEDAGTCTEYPTQGQEQGQRPQARMGLTGLTTRKCAWSVRNEERRVWGARSGRKQGLKGLVSHLRTLDFILSATERHRGLQREDCYDYVVFKSSLWLLLGTNHKKPLKWLQITRNH